MKSVALWQINNYRLPKQLPEAMKDNVFPLSLSNKHSTDKNDLQSYAAII